MFQIKGHTVPHVIRDCHVSKTAGGRTTWIELFSNADASGPTSLIQGDTGDIKAWAEDILEKIREEE